MDLPTAPPDTPQPLLLAAVEGAREVFDKLATVDATFLAVGEKERLLTGLVALERQVEGLLVDTLAVAGDVAEAHGARSVTGWLARVVNADPGEVRRLERLGEDCAARYPAVQARLRAGAISVNQAVTITRSLDRLGHDVVPEIRDQALEHLLSLAEEFAPQQLKLLGRTVLQCIDPDLFDADERKRLEDELAAASDATRLRFWKHGDGATGFKGVVPDHVAHRLATYLAAYSNPRVDAAATDEESRYRDPVTGRRLSAERVRGEAFCAFLESIDPGVMPQQGGTATTVVVTLDFEALTTGLGTATLSNGDKITAAEARRLAARARILPVVLGGDSEVLDLGRSRRLFTAAQRRAIMQRHTTCAVEGCDVPVEQTELHHIISWAQGGPTDLTNAAPACRFHNILFEDERYAVELRPDGQIRVTLKTTRLRT